MYIRRRHAQRVDRMLKFENSKIDLSSKGISPLIATVLLIAFTVAVAAIISVWLTTFTSTSTQTVSSRAETELYCMYGGISLSDLKYCNGYLSGTVENTRLVDLGNITLQIFYTNASSKTIRLNKSAGGFMALEPREKDTFNVSGIDSNYDKIHLYTNCSTVYDDASSGDVTTC